MHQDSTNKLMIFSSIIQSSVIAPFPFSLPFFPPLLQPTPPIYYLSEHLRPNLNKMLIVCKILLTMGNGDLPHFFFTNICCKMTSSQTICLLQLRTGEITSCWQMIMFYRCWHRIINRFFLLSHICFSVIVIDLNSTLSVTQNNLSSHVRALQLLIRHPFSLVFSFTSIPPFLSLSSNEV